MEEIIFKHENIPRLLKTLDFRLRTLNPEKEYRLEIKENRKNRSLNANAYCWQLITRISEVITVKKEDVYIEMLKRYGQQFLVKIPKKEIGKFKSVTQYFEEHEKLYDEKAIYYRVFVGSSNYNTKEMSSLIEGIVSECKELGIETKTPSELAKIISLWREEQ